MGPLMLDVEGLVLNDRERRQLADPQVGGVILFSRNFSDLAQLTALVASIRQAAGGPLLIAVDHEGGRVQRFRKGFSAIPAMGAIGRYCRGDDARAQLVARELGWLMAAELLAVDIDISFAPVLDLDIVSEVIGDRSFSADPQQVVTIGAAFIEGMAEAGMRATGKHFPGHGSIEADSHIAIPVDSRPMGDIRALDMSVFEALIKADALRGIMPAHVIYDQAAPEPAGFSRFWLQEILRAELGFDGVIFSDDLAMEGATVAGSSTERAKAALDAGCDMVLVCNQPAMAAEVLDWLHQHYPLDRHQVSTGRLQRMLPDSGERLSLDALRHTARWKNAHDLCEAVACG